MRDPITNEVFWVGHRRIAVVIFLAIASISLIIADTFFEFVDLIEWSLGGLLLILFPYVYGNFFHQEYYYGGTTAWSAPTGIITGLGWIMLVGALLHFIYALVRI